MARNWRRELKSLRFITTPNHMFALE